MLSLALRRLRGSSSKHAMPISFHDLFVEMLKEKYELKEVARLGPSAADAREARILNRIVRWTDRGLEYEADRPQGEKFIE